MTRCASLALLIATVLAQSAGAVTFADGLIHVLDAEHSFPFEDVVVADGPQAEATILNVLEGANVGAFGNATGLRALGRSIVHVSGGLVGAGGFAAGLLATDSSRVAISGGSIGGRGVDLRGDATLEISGGFLGGLGVDQDARLRFTGGEVFSRAFLSGGASEISGGFLHRGLVVGNAELVFSGGVVDRTLEAVGAAKVSIGGSRREGDTFFVGGTLRGDLDVSDAAEVSITGGVVQDDILARRRGQIAIRGGQLNGRLDVEDQAIVTFVGRDFAVTQNFHDVDVSGGEIPVAFGHLTGRLANFRWPVSLLFSKDAQARILLERAPLVVDVEVQPRRASKRIDPFSRRAVSVAILGSDVFDVGSVDLASLRFGPGGAPPLARSGGYQTDVNRDGFEDLVSLYRIPRTGIAVGDSEACVAGATLDGEPFSGCGAIEAIAPRELRGAAPPRRH